MEGPGPCAGPGSGRHSHVPDSCRWTEDWNKKLRHNSVAVPPPGPANLKEGNETVSEHDKCCLDAFMTTRIVTWC